MFLTLPREGKTHDRNKFPTVESVGFLKARNLCYVLDYERGKMGRDRVVSVVRELISIFTQNFESQ